MKGNIGIFGGSFDPPHLGHLSIIKEALTNLPIEKLIVIPTFLNPFKATTHHSCEERLEMLIKITRSLKNIEISDFECQKGSSYSFDTVCHFKAIYDPQNIFLIIGEDNLEKLHTWYRFGELEQMVEFVVATRKIAKPIPHNYKTLNVNVDISSTQLRKKGKQLEQRLEDIKNILDNKKAENIEVFDVKNKGYLVDYVVVATTLNNKHGFALLDYLKEDLKPQGEEFLRVDEDDNWTVIDLGDIFIHLMSEQYRAKYNIEDFLKELASPKK